MVEQHPYSAIPELALVTAIAQLAGDLSAMQCELLAIAAEFDRRQGWRDDGASDLASHLASGVGQYPEPVPGREPLAWHAGHGCGGQAEQTLVVAVVEQDPA